MLRSRASSRPPPVGNPWKSRLVAFGLAGAAAAAATVVAPAWLVGTARAVAAYDVGAGILILVFWTLGMHRNPQNTARRASAEDPGRNAMMIVVLLSVAVALSSAVIILGRGPHLANANEKAIAYALAIAAAGLGWGLIHTMFAFRYAHLYYYDDDEDNEADRGLTFPGTDDPNDYDFAYFSFVIGMTFQVSDVQVTDRGVRRVVMVHGLISFAYNTTILALGINILSGLLH